MPRFYFHVRDGVDQPDRVGTVLPDPQAARAEALMLAGKIIEEAGARRAPGEEWVVEVTDEAGLTLFRMEFIVEGRAAPARPAWAR